jgi:hypothetical protein
MLCRKLTKTTLQKGAVTMVVIDSSVEGYQTTYRKLRDLLYAEGFHLGGGYEYDHGYFDHALDWEENEGYHYYLRIPAYALQGELDDPDAIIQLGKPFIIKHEFLKNSNDLTEDIGVASALVNQFTKPIPADQDEIDEKWIVRAKSIMQKIQEKLIQEM